MNDWRHLQDSVLLRQSGELPEAEARELARKLESDPAVARLAGESDALIAAYKQSSAEDIPATPELTLERIIREGRRQAAAVGDRGQSFWLPLKLAAGIGVVLVGIGAAIFYLRNDGSRALEIAKQAPPAPAAIEAPSNIWASLESNAIDLRMAELDSKIDDALSDFLADGVASMEDSLAEELLRLEKDSI